MLNNNQILEALQMQPLSEEEKSARHILGRLYGPIATSNEGTRNGRKYNKELWEKALSDDLFKEKINNKALFLELGHPADREETDMTCVCACIPEVPKIINGDLYAYVDILDTNNGRLLKTLCDYGFIPGISSRGSGDIMPNDEVDPETFFLETWDIVSVPAVKKARLQVCESLETNNKEMKLAKALRESLEAVSDEDKKPMEEALKNLDIKLEEEKQEINVDAIPWADGEEPLNEESEVEEETPAEKEAPDEEEPEEAEVEEVADYTVADLTKDLKDFDKDFVIEFKPIEIDGTEYKLDMLDFEPNEDDKKVVINVGFTADDNINKAEEEIPEAEDVDTDEPDASVEEADIEAEEESEEAVDNGADEVFENLKEAIRQKDLLEQEVKDLKNEKTVRDAEVKTLEENLTKYKSAFARTSEVAAKANKLETSNKQLQEQLTKQTKELDEVKRANSKSLAEGLDSSKKQINMLKEQLEEAKANIDELQKQSAKQAMDTRRKLVESVNTVNKYKSMCTEIMNKFISYRASMLGVKPAEILSRLDEKYSFDDIEKACDSILNEGMNMNNRFSSYNGLQEAKRPMVKFNEPKAKTDSYKYSYDIDDSLLELAGLKK